jgi:hypothetical protein
MVFGWWLIGPEIRYGYLDWQSLRALTIRASKHILGMQAM